MRNTMVWSSSTQSSSVTLTVRFLDKAPVGPNVTDFVAIWKSPGFWALTYSLARLAPCATTCTENSVDVSGRRLIVTGTLNDPPETSSSTLPVCGAVAVALAPNATRAPSSSSSAIVTVARRPEAWRL